MVEVVYKQLVLVKKAFMIKELVLVVQQKLVQLVHIHVKIVPDQPQIVQNVIPLLILVAEVVH